MIRLAKILLSSALSLLLSSSVQAQTVADPLATRLTEIAAELAPDTEPLGPVEFGVLAEGGSRFVDVPITGDRCYSFIAVGDASAEDLDLHLYASRIEVAEHTGQDNFPAVYWCNRSLDRVSVEIRMYRGSGRYAFQVFASRSRPQTRDSTLWATIDGLAAQYAEGLLPAAQPVYDVLGMGGENEFIVRFAGGRCYVILGAGSRTVSDLDLTLLDGTRSPIESDHAPDAQPVLRYCAPPDGGGAYYLHSHLVAGYGEYAILVLGD